MKSTTTIAAKSNTSVFKFVGVFTLLLIGTYVLCASLTDNIAFAQTPAYPTLQALEGNNNPSLAYGLDGISDWGTEMPFIDIMKLSRAWIGHLPGRWGGMSYDEIKASGVLDENGWPRQLPTGVEKIGTVWAWSSPQHGAEAFRAGAYTLTYKGEGTIVVSGRLQNVVQTPGKITFTSPGNIDLALNITSTDPNKTGNYIRDISIVKDEYADLHAAGVVFNPDWIKLVKDVRQIRFMDWVHVINSKERIWTERAHPETYTWSIAVPLEIMVQLSNEIGADPWFNIPFHADDTYAREYATYVRDNLNPDLVATIEFSNEVWNTSFGQTQDAIRLAQADFGIAGGAGFANYYGKRASQIMRIFTEVYGTQTNARLQRVAGSFTQNPWLTAQILEAPMWKADDASAYVAPHTYFDAVGVTTYFGSTIISNQAHREALLNSVADLGNNDYEYITAMLRGEISGFEKGSIPELKKLLAEQKKVVDRYNMDLVLYEGGQHVHHSAFVNVPQDELNELQTFLSGFTRSQEMADLYEELWDIWQEIGDGPFMQFTDVERPSIYGSWGTRASLSDSTPRSMFLDEQNARTDAWFEDRSGDHFKQGKTVVGTDVGNILAGTRAADYLLAKEGDDTIYPGLGNDSVSGGGGIDTLLLRGNSSTYRVTLQSSRFIVTGPDGKDSLSGVERLQFEDGATRTLSADTVDTAVLPTITSKFAANSRVVTNDTPTVRSSFGTGATSLGAQVVGSLGTVGTQSAQNANGYTWIYINFDIGVDGWVADSFLNAAVVIPTPTPTPNPVSGFNLSDDVLLIGHSLVGTVMPAYLQGAVKSQTGGTGDVKFHVINGSPLKYNWDNSASAQGVSALDVLPGGDYEVVVMTEAIPLLSHTKWSDTNGYAARFYNLTINSNPNARVYFYETWHCLATGTPTGCSNDNDDSLAWRPRLTSDLPKWEAIVDSVNAQRTSGSKPMMIVPAGQAFARLHDEITAGKVPGISSINALFKDDIHPNDLGRYFVAMVQYATVYGRTPVGLPTQMKNEWGTNMTAPSSALATKMQEVAWEVVSTYSRSGVTGDVNTTPAPTSKPTVTLVVSPASVTSGGASTLTWSSTNATACTASGAWTGPKAVSGTQSVSPTVAATYTLSCTGKGGTVTQNVTVSVVSAPVNKPPVAVDDVTSVDANGTVLEFNVLSNDNDENKDPLLVTAVNNVPGTSGGKFTITNDGLVTFNPNRSFDKLTVGQEKITTYTYKISDGKLTDTGVITVTVRGVKPVETTTTSTAAITTATNDTSITSRGLLIDGGNEENTATVALGSKGVMVNAINYSSKLGKELKLASSKMPAYVVIEIGATASINDKTVKESYWSMFEDKESSGGSPLTGSAVTTSLLFGSVLTNFEKIAGTDSDDLMFGREANDYFIVKKGTDYIDGRSGIDTVRLLGNSTDYTIVQSGSRYKLSSSQSAVNFSEIEYLEFEDGKFTPEELFNRSTLESVLGVTKSVPEYNVQIQKLLLQLQLLKQQLRN